MDISAPKNIRLFTKRKLLLAFFLGIVLPILIFIVYVHISGGPLRDYIDYEDSGPLLFLGVFFITAFLGTYVIILLYSYFFAQLRSQIASKRKTLLFWILLAFMTLFIIFLGFVLFSLGTSFFGVGLQQDPLPSISQ